ncbi:MAG: ATP-dependent DNA helicase RecG, partial [Chloroflexota bacterium]|nr:ATP-dependent DNA helicase RecG [Chloroflexota bacterium]
MATTAETGKRTKRDELLEALRDEWKRGFDNRVVMGGMRALQAEYGPFVPPEVFAALRHYSTLDAAGRKQALTLAGKLLNAPPPPPAPPPASGGGVTLRDVSANAQDSWHKPSDQSPLPRLRAEGQGVGAKPKPPPVVKPMSLGDEVMFLRGVGPKNAALFEKMKVRTIGDLLYLVPRRHDDYSQLRPLGHLNYGDVVTVVGTVLRIAEVPTASGKSRTQAVVMDESGTINVTWFSPYVARQLHQGERVALSGTVEEFRGLLTFTNPEWERIEPGADLGSRIIPVYPLTDGLYQKTVRSVVRAAIAATEGQIPDWLPDDVRQAQGLIPLGEAVPQFHFPDSTEAYHRARTRLMFDEYFLMQLGMVQRKQAWQAEAMGAAMPADAAMRDEFLARLPFTLTGAQQRTLETILAEMAHETAMSRLIQGDVGSGKTVVAAAAMYAAVRNGYQAALMAPTEILAEQHFRTLKRLFDAFPADRRPYVELLTGSTRVTQRRPILDGLQKGVVHILVGTHALIEDPVVFANLGFVVVDEQHRFGVGQRARLRSKARNIAPHMLVMTATPIPRSLALTLHGDLDVSTIDELPPGRTPVETHVIRGDERERAYDAVRDAVAAGNQAFIICPLVEESETLEAKSAVAEHKRLQEVVFPELSLGLLHGKMPPRTKDKVMSAFRDVTYHVLVATSVVEVGIDVPNATVMLIEGADRFGLSQLHQFRGRVGRGRDASTCLLIADDVGRAGRERLM